VRRALLLSGLTVAGLGLVRRYCTVVTVRGHSMNPTLVNGQRVIVIRRPLYRVGDVVVFRTPGAAGTPGDPDHRIKRVIAVGGAPRPDVFTDSTLPATVPAGHLAVAGDNVGRSQDSRHLGYIALSDVIGRVGPRILRRLLPAAS
jgi:signal peptidase I